MTVISLPPVANETGALRRAIDHAAHLLPAQGPIGVFVHHNTLHAFEGLLFEDAVAEAAKIFGAEPYMTEAAYRRQLTLGRIHVEDIDAVLAREPNAPILGGPGLDRFALRRAILRRGIPEYTAANIGWHLEEGDVLRRLRQDLPEAARRRLLADASSRVARESSPPPASAEDIEAFAARELFAACRRRAESPGTEGCDEPVRPRDGLLTAFGVDLDELIHPLLIRLCSTFLDQGQACWPMPFREEGFLRACRKLLGLPGAVHRAELQGLSAEVRRQEREGLDAEQVIERTLAVFGVAPEETARVIEAELLALPGWAGMMRQLEEKPELAPHEPVPCSLAEFLAVRLTLAQVAAARLVSSRGAGRLATAWRVSARRSGSADAGRLAAAARLAEIAQVCGLVASELDELDDRTAARLLREVEAFDGLERRRLLHQAYERRHERRILSPLAEHRRSIRPAPPAAPAAQVFFCLDEREESLRRHLEEIDPRIETLGAAGFFGVAIDYLGMDDVRGAPLCPIVVKPRHAIHEQPDREHQDAYRMRQARRRLWSQLAHGSFRSSRTLLGGWLSAAGLGMLSLFPLTARILAPRSYAKLRKRLNALFLPVPRTELTLMRDDESGRLVTEGLQLGFTTEEKVDRVAGVLGPAGLYDRFARLVVVLGHGSTSLNNPHESAYNCGACGGRSGGPNSRLFAAMCNRPAVRRGLAERGIHIPQDTWFIGGCHDSCSDDIELYDLDRAPATHAEDLLRVRQSLDQARAAGAHERVRRFSAASHCKDPASALRHVEERSEHLAEPRPEYGHSSNAVCIVGRRETTRGLFLDRRAFLSSYDAAVDPDDQNLTLALSAVVPVCAGINLEYYFSYVDNERYGCGSKLPHNVTSLLGVMNGHASDLRTGLTWQMVEIHEPVRILFVVETTPQRLLHAARRNADVMRLLDNRWIRMATLDPSSGAIHVYRDGAFGAYEVGDDEPLRLAGSSRDWYAGQSGHLPLAQISRTAEAARAAKPDEASC